MFKDCIMMKKMLYGLMAGLMVLASGCDGVKDGPENNGNNNGGNGGGEKAEITVDEESAALFANGIEASNNEGEYEIGFTASDPWTISSEETKAPASWISFSPSNGAAGPAKVKITVEENSGVDKRSATITITSGGVKKTLTLEQAAALAVKAKYSDFLGSWLVTGTEHESFLGWDDLKEVHTFTYCIYIEKDEEGKTYYISDWETGATAEDFQYLYYGGEKHADKTGGRSIYEYFRDVVKKSIGLTAWYDSENGTLHIDRQTFFTGDYYTVEFLGSNIDPDGGRFMPRGQFAANVTETEKYEYTICDFVMLEGGDVVIKAHEQTDSNLKDLAFMGYCQYYGWYPSPKYYNTQFAFPYVMVNNNPR